MAIQSLQTLRHNGCLSPGQPNAAYSGGLWNQTHQGRENLGGGSVLRAELAAVFAEWASWLRR